MLLKVSIVKGTGRVSCMMPGFFLDEDKGKSSCFVAEITPEMKEMEKFEMIIIEKATKKQYRDFRAKCSVGFDKRAKKRKIRQLKRRIETGGKMETILGTGVTITVDPGEVAPDVIKAEAEAELKQVEVLEAPPVRDEKDDPKDVVEEGIDGLEGFDTIQM